jgi:hypothetical protein
MTRRKADIILEVVLCIEDHECSPECLCWKLREIPEIKTLLELHKKEDASNRTNQG